MGLARVRQALALAQAGVPAADAGRMDPDRPGQALTWHPHRSQPSVPSGPRARVEANLAASISRVPPRERRAYDRLSSAAPRAGVSERTLRRWIAEGRLAGYRVGPRLLRVHRAELDALFSAVPTAARAKLR